MQTLPAYAQCPKSYWKLLTVLSFRDKEGVFPSAVASGQLDSRESGSNTSSKFFSSWALPLEFLPQLCGPPNCIVAHNKYNSVFYLCTHLYVYRDGEVIQIFVWMHACVLQGYTCACGDQTSMLCVFLDLSSPYRISHGTWEAGCSGSSRVPLSSAPTVGLCTRIVDIHCRPQLLHEFQKSKFQFSCRHIRRLIDRANISSALQNDYVLHTPKMKKLRNGRPQSLVGEEKGEKREWKSASLALEFMVKQAEGKDFEELCTVWHSTVLLQE